MSIMKALIDLSNKLVEEGITEDLVIYNEEVFNRLRMDMFLLNKYSSEPFNSGSGEITLWTPHGKIKVIKDTPETVEKKVRDELNRRAMYTLRHKR